MQRPHLKRKGLPEREKLSEAIVRVVEWSAEVKFLEQALSKATNHYYFSQRELDEARTAYQAPQKIDGAQAARFLGELDFEAAFGANQERYETATNTFKRYTKPSLVSVIGLPKRGRSWRGRSVVVLVRLLPCWLYHRN